MDREEATYNGGRARLDEDLGILKRHIDCGYGLLS